jgi:hypothetical protein
MCWVWRHELVSKTKVIKYNDYLYNKKYFNSSNNIIVKQLFQKHIEKLMHSLQMYRTKDYVIEGITIGMWKETMRNWQVRCYEYLFVAMPLSI